MVLEAFCSACRRSLYLPDDELELACPVCSSPVQVTAHSGETARVVRIADNETFFREANERVKERTREDGGMVAFMCECGNAECRDVLHLTIEEYNRVRSDRRHFAIRPGHEEVATERVIEVGGHYAVVEKIGPGRSIAEELDPPA